MGKGLFARSGQFLRERREQVDLTVCAAATAIGTVSSHWSMMEHGHQRVPPARVQQIAAVLDIDADELIDVVAHDVGDIAEESYRQLVHDESRRST